MNIPNNLLANRRVEHIDIEYHFGDYDEAFSDIMISPLRNLYASNVGMYFLSRSLPGFTTARKMETSWP